MKEKILSVLIVLLTGSAAVAQNMSQFKLLSDSAYQTNTMYQSSNKYQKDAMIFMDFVADTHPYYVKPERREEWYAKKAAILEQCKNIESDETFVDALISVLGSIHDKHTDIYTVQRMQALQKATNEQGTANDAEKVDMSQVMSPHNSFYDYKFFPEESICYLQFNKCSNAPDYPFDRFLNDMFAKMKENHIKTLVVDAQYNGGGNSQLCSQLLTYLYPADKLKHLKTNVRFSDLLATICPESAQMKKDWENDGHKDELYQIPSPKIPDDYQQPTLYEGQVVFVMGAKTYSSAGILMTLARDNHIGTIIGTNSIFSPSHYGEILPYRLPNTDVLGTISCKFFERPDSASVDETFLKPDYEVDLRDKAAAWQFIVNHFSVPSKTNNK